VAKPKRACDYKFKIDPTLFVQVKRKVGPIWAQLSRSVPHCHVRFVSQAVQCAHAITDVSRCMQPTRILDDDALLGEMHAAEFLKLSPRTLQAWRPQGRGPRFVRAGRAVRYRRRDLIAWIEENTVAGPSRSAKQHSPGAAETHSAARGPHGSGIPLGPTLSNCSRAIELGEPVADRMLSTVFGSKDTR